MEFKNRKCEKKTKLKRLSSAPFWGLVGGGELINQMKSRDAFLRSGSFCCK